jgi:hypothetical protein
MGGSEKNNTGKGYKLNLKQRHGQPIAQSK